MPNSSDGRGPAIHPEDWVLAQMLFHDQPTTAEAWFARRRLRAAAAQAPNARTVRVSTADLVAALQAADLTAAAEESTRQGHVAGSLLSIVLQMHLAGEPEPSMQKAMMQAYASWGLTRRYGDGKALPRSKMTIQQAWNRHRPVAHYWAALEATKMTDGPLAGEFARRTVFSDPDVFARFLMLARKFADFGTTFTQKRARRGASEGSPLLDAATLVPVPDLSKAR